MSQILAGSRDRSEYGCIMTFENEHGKTFSIHRKGPPMKAVRAACAIALALDETFRVVSYSTPGGIYTDMQGARLGSSRSSDEVSPDSRASSVEGIVLARAGLRDSLEPLLRFEHHLAQVVHAASEAAAMNFPCATPALDDARSVSPEAEARRLESHARAVRWLGLVRSDLAELGRVAA